jgi:hypothetical protein
MWRSKPLAFARRRLGIFIPPLLKYNNYAKQRSLLDFPKSSLCTYLKEATHLSDDLGVLAQQYRAGKSLPILDEGLKMITRERHCLELNERLHSMLTARPGTTRSAESTLAEYKRLASLVTIESYSSLSLGDEKSDLFMESLSKSFSIKPDDATEVKFRFEWTLARKNIPGMVKNECSAKLIANDTGIASASDVHRSMSKEAIAAIADHVKASTIPLADFSWFLSFIATFPSDEAFDVLSELLVTPESG